MRRVAVCLIAAVVSLMIAQGTHATESRVIVSHLATIDANNPEGFRQALMTWMAVLAERAPPGPRRDSAVRVYREFELLSYEQMELLQESFQDPQAFADAVLSLAQFHAERIQPWTSLEPFEKGIVGLPPGSTPVQAPYPTGGFYDAFVLAALSTLGNLTDDGGATAPDPDGRVRDEHCNSNGYAILLSVLNLAKLAAIPAQALCDADPTGVSCAGVAVLNMAVWIAEQDLIFCDLQDGNVDSAEIEATYENVLSIFNSLICVAAQGPRKIHGCNGEDDNCNQIIDECGEDAFGPEVHIDPIVKAGWFSSSSAAMAAVDDAVHATDDCQSIVVGASALAGTCDTVTASVIATDNCGNSTAASITIMVDESAPFTACNVTVNELWPPNHEMIDVGFTLTATDDCGDPEVIVSVTSDEPTAQAVGAGQASPAPDAEILRTLDGVVHGARIRAERSTEGDGRVYEITVTAIDAAGNSSSTSCNVSVRASKNSGPAVDSGQFYIATAVN